MRLTPPQNAMLMLLGHSLTRSPSELREQLVRGRSFLVSTTGEDFGYDPIHWHQHLIANNVADYCFGHWEQSVPDLIAEAKARKDWRDTRAALELENVLSPDA
jgi:hypothetical protein